MKCPMIMLGYEWQKDTPKHLLLDCLKEDCAWWDAPMTQCNFVAISLRLGAIFEQLAIIQNKMPHKKE